MDTVTHGIVGALIGKAFFAEDPSQIAPTWLEKPRTAGRVAIISATLGAIFPDIDVFAGPIARNPLALIAWHRSLTHSLVLLPAWGLLLAALTYGLARLIDWPAPNYGMLTAIYAIGLASHVFLDLITSFGTMIWSPLDYSRPAWDWLFIIDLSLTSLALLPQLAAWAYQRPKRAVRRAISTWAVLTAIAFSIGPLVQPFNVPFTTDLAVVATVVFAAFLLLPLRRGVGTRSGRSKFCRIGFAITCFYVAFAGTTHHSALQQVSDFAEQNGLGAQSVAALPLPPTLARWSGLIAAAGGIYRLQFNLFDAERVQIRFFRDAAPNSYIAAARELPGVQKFLWFARFPLFEFLTVNGQPVVHIADLRFYGVGRPQPISDPADEITTGFTYEVVFAPDGHVVSEGLLRTN